MSFDSPDIDHCTDTTVVMLKLRSVKRRLWNCQFCIKHDSISFRLKKIRWSGISRGGRAEKKVLLQGTLSLREIPDCIQKSRKDILFSERTFAASKL